MKVFLELAPESRRHHLEAEFGHIGCVLRNTQSCHECSVVAGGPSTDLDGSKYFIRLPQESLLDFNEINLGLLRKHCLDAGRSEEFFLIANATDQSLRTVVEYKDLSHIPETSWWFLHSHHIIVHSNVLPYHPYWSSLQTTRHGNVHFPFHILQDALNEGKTLRTKLKETGIQEPCALGRHRCGNGKCKWTSRLFRNIQAADVKLVKSLYGSVSEGILLITWRGGQFVQKVFEADTTFGMEVEVVKMLSHPNIVYSFGKLDDQRSYFMEYMSNDLFKVIVDRIDRVVGDNNPPFVAHEAVDVLSQVAKAMRHVHQENVVHCDLKSGNILVSEIETPYDLNGKHYLVKVADFGSARLLGNPSSDRTSVFTAGNGTTEYSAPEVLLQRTDRGRPIELPLKIDVYSFGMVAFEVLTGKLINEVYKPSPGKFKREVIEGSWRPPLLAECETHKEFIQDKELMSLIERCWHPDPEQRPSFEEICKGLDEARGRIPEQILQSHNPPQQVNSITKFFQGLRWPNKNDHKRKSCALD